MKKEDLKPGMAVELRNGKYGLVIPNQSGLLIAHVEGDTLRGLVSTESLSDGMKHLNRECKSYDVMKVYGLTENGGLLLCQNKDKRELLWERPIELKRCPFCGNEKAVELDNTLGEDDVPELQWCVVCNYNNGGCGATGGYKESEQEAIEAWNRRAE